MLSYIVSTVILLVIVVLVFRFFRRYSIVRVVGDSMFPTLKDGNIRIVDRLFLREKQPHIMQDTEVLKSRIFVYYSPTHGQPVIKRLVEIATTIDGVFLWFEGDNKDFSEDSRAYGFITLDSVVGELVPLKTVIKTLFKN